MKFESTEDYEAYKAEQAAIENAPGKVSEKNPTQSAGSAGAPVETQEEKVKRDRTFEGRISELTGERERVAKERDDARRELDEFKQSQRKTVEERVATPAAKTEEKKELKKLKEFVASFPEDTPYEDILEAYYGETEKHISSQLENRLEQMLTDRETKTKERSEAESKITQVNQKIEANLVDVKKTYPDFEAKMNEKWVVPGIKDVIQRYVTGGKPLDVLYHLATHPADVEAMKDLDSDSQLMFVGRIAAQLNSPEKPKQSISRVQPQVQRLGAGSSILKDDDEQDFKGDADARERARAKR